MQIGKKRKIAWKEYKKRVSPRAEDHLFAGNDQVFNWYFWKGPTLGYSKQDFLKLGSGGLRFY